MIEVSFRYGGHDWTATVIPSDMGPEWTEVHDLMCEGEPVDHDPDAEDCAIQAAYAAGAQMEPDYD